MVDLHIHSSYSDGSDSIRDILSRAEKLKLELISITDHNSMAAYREIREDSNLRQTFSGKIIPGCEVLATYKGNFIEVLGYVRNIDKFSKTLIDSLYIESTILEQYINVSKIMGLSLDIDKMRRELLKQKYSAMGIFVRELISNPEYASHFHLSDDPCSRFSKNFYNNPNTPFYVNEKRFYKDIRSVIYDIHECGGVAVLAHPFVYPFSNKEFIEDILCNVPFDGIECEYPEFNKSEREYLKFLCRYYGLVLSGGSDYHGINRISNSLATGVNDNLSIPYDMVCDWTRPLEKILIK